MTVFNLQYFSLKCLALVGLNGLHQRDTTTKGSGGFAGHVIKSFEFSRNNYKMK